MAVMPPIQCFCLAHYDKTVIFVPKKSHLKVPSGRPFSLLLPVFKKLFCSVDLEIGAIVCLRKSASGNLKL